MHNTPHLDDDKVPHALCYEIIEAAVVLADAMVEESYATFMYPNTIRHYDASQRLQEKKNELQTLTGLAAWKLTQ